MSILNTLIPKPKPLKKSGDLKIFPKNFFEFRYSQQIKQLCFFLMIFKKLFLPKYKTSKMFQNLISGDLLNFPQKSSGSDFTPSKMFYVSSKYYYLLFKFQKCQKILKTGKQVIFGIFQDSFSGLKISWKYFKIQN
jgi:hypothetical protein